MRLFKPPHQSQMGSLDRDPPAALDQEQHDAVDTSSIVAAMKRATTDLDDILQQLCSAMPESMELRPATAANPVMSSSGGEYLQSIKDTLKASRDSTMIVPRHNQSKTEESDVKDPISMQKLFDLGCKDLSIVFQAPISAEDKNPLRAAHGGTIRSCDQLKRHIYDQLIACDHLIPAAMAIFMATCAVHRALLRPFTNGADIVRLIFPGEATTRSNQGVDNVDWKHGDRVCYIYAQESDQGQQWGLKLTIVVAFTLNVQHKSSAENMKHSPPLDLIVSSTHTLFLRKDDYSKSPSDDLISCDQEVRLTLDEEKHVEMTSNPGNQTTDVDDGGILSNDALASTLPELLSVFTWGDHERLEPVPANATDGKLVPLFRPMANFNTPFPRNRIVQAACSGFHTLLLNDVGLVFSYGHNMDGALGRDRSEARNEYVSSPQLVEFFIKRLISVRAIACAGNFITGCHSAAVSRDGDVFTWGVGIALGNGSSQSLDTPQQIELPRIPSTVSNQRESQEDDAQVKIDSIACGSGFCIALAQDGHAFAWGKWSDGRLGLGKIPILNRSSRRHGNRHQVKSFQLSPIMLPGRTFLKVSCGDAHCVGLTRQNQLVAWGRGGHGQLGRGSLVDALSPIPVVCEQTKWMDVSAGEDWSMTVDDIGRVWSWGACGSSVLGHGRPVSNTRATTVLETILERHQRLVSSSLPNSTESLPPPTLPQLGWMTPRLIPTFASGVRIRSVSSGRQHAAAISKAGDLYLWGDGDGFCHHPSLVCGGQTDTNDSEVGSRIVAHVACGGSQVFTFVGGSFLASSLRQLYQQCLQLSPFADDFQMNCRLLGVDIVLLSSATRLYAHKVVLARRSSVFREMILNEQRDQSEASDSNTSMELLLPQIRADVARILVEFMYTDNVSCKLDPQAYLIRDVLRAAQLYQLPTLEKLCAELIATAITLSSSLFGSLNGDGDQKKNGVSEAKRSLNGDMQYAFGDSTWTDLTLVAENKEIRVHRCMLVARSDYFLALLAFQAKAADANASSGAIVVDESYVGMLRVLNFIYHDHVQPEDSDDEQLLEDLITADKYGLARMKRLCEHSIKITLVNCLEVFAVADMATTTHLKQSALEFIQSNLQQVISESSFQTFKADFPHLLRELYEAIRASNRDDFALLEWQQAVDAQWRLQQDAQQREWKAKTDAAGKFPFLPLVLTIVFATLYLSVMRIPAYDYPLVPAVNFMALGGLLTASFFGWV